MWNIQWLNLVKNSAFVKVEAEYSGDELLYIIQKWGWFSWDAIGSNEEMPAKFSKIYGKMEKLLNENLPQRRDSRNNEQISNIRVLDKILSSVNQLIYFLASTPF